MSKADSLITSAEDCLDDSDCDYSNEKPANEEDCSDVKNADQLLDKLGSKNYYIRLVIFILSLAWIVGVMPLMCSAFITDEIECDSSDNKSDENCEGRSTIISEFDLRGDRQYLADWTTSAYMMGGMVGGSVMAYVSDKNGRRPVLLISLVTMGLAGLASSLMNNIHSFTITRFVQGICMPGIVITSWVLVFECIPKNMRGFTTFLFGTMWVVGYCLIAPMAYYITSWRYLIVASIVPCFLMAVISIFFVPESLHFLVNSKKMKEVERWIRKAQKFERKDFSMDANFYADSLIKASILEDEKSENKSMSVTDGSIRLQRNKITTNIIRHIGQDVLRYSPILELYTAFALTCVWKGNVSLLFMIVNTLVYFGLSLFTTKLAGNKYWNYTLSGLAELPAYLVGPISIEWFGRRPVISVSHILAGLSLISILFVSEESTMFLVALWLVGKFSISCSFLCIFVYANEIFPTTMRNVCSAICSFLARFGGILAPYVRLLAAIHPLLPMLFLGSITLLAGILTLFLPETRGRDLPTSLDDIV